MLIECIVTLFTSDYLHKNKIFYFHIYHVLCDLQFVSMHLLYSYYDFFLGITQYRCAYGFFLLPLWVIGKLFRNRLIYDWSWYPGGGSVLAAPTGSPAISVWGWEVKVVALGKRNPSYSGQLSLLILPQTPPNAPPAPNAFEPGAGFRSTLWRRKNDSTIREIKSFKL